MPTPRSVRSVELTHRQIAGIILLACVPLPVLSLAATVVPLPEMVERAAARFIPFAPPTLGDESRHVALTVPAKARPAAAPRRPSAAANVVQPMRTPGEQSHSSQPATRRSDQTAEQRQSQQQPRQPTVAAAEPSPEVSNPEAAAPVVPSNVATAPKKATAKTPSGNAAGQTAEKQRAAESKDGKPGNQPPVEPPGHSEPENSGTGNSGQGNGGGNEEKPGGNGRP